MSVIPTDEELRIIQDPHFLILKQKVSEKIVRHLSRIERALHREIKNSGFPFPKGTFLKAGKISRGENYRGLPYFILDYPRLFSRDDVFAFRVMLWWGREFSCTLHLSGNPLQNSLPHLLKNLPKADNLFFCINSSPWEYHFEDDNYVPASALIPGSIQTHVDRNGFIKISNRITLSRWDKFESFTLMNFARFLRYIN